MLRNQTGILAGLVLSLASIGFAQTSIPNAPALIGEVQNHQRTLDAIRENYTFMKSSANLFRIRTARPRRPGRGNLKCSSRTGTASRGS
jgi:hypothetical protein